MTRIGLESLVREIEPEFRHVEAKIEFQAVDANGDYISVVGSNIIFSPRVVMILRNGVPDQIPDLQPTDGSFGWSVRASIESARYWRKWLKGVPESTEVVPFGALPNLDRATLQPTEESTSAWQAAIDENRDIRDETAGLRDEAGESAAQAREVADGIPAAVVAAIDANLDTLKGDPGADAYQVAVANGFVGSEAAWLASLKGADGASPTTQAYRDALAPLVGAASGVGSLDASGKQPEAQVPARLAAAALTRAFVSVRTSDGQQLPAGTVVVITLDKTLAQVTATPVADIADITFTTGA